MLKILRRLDVGGLLLAFVVVDAIGAAVVFGLLGLGWLGIVVAVLSVVLTVAGYLRTGASPRLRLATLGALVFLLLFLPQLLLVVAQPPNASIIDGVLLNDAAADRLLSGHDPYVGDFLNTPMRAFYLSDVPVNFGLVRYVYMPGMAILDVPVRLLHSDRANFSWLFLPGLLALAAAAWSLGRSRAEKEAALIVVTLSPLFQLDFFYLLNDLFFLAPALAGIGMLRRGRVVWAGVMLGLALAMKQQAILFLPLLAIYAVFHLERRLLLKLTSAGAALLMITVLPFFLWNPAAFLAGTAGFFYGSGVDAYPIRGLGLQGILLQLGVIGNRWDYFPSAQVQAPLLVILLALALRDLRRRWSWTHFWVWLGGEALIAFAFGRVLSPNYLDLVVMLFLLALASALVGEAPIEAVGRAVDRPASRGGVVGVDAPHDPGHLPAV
ncbi:MAG TPA: glycosyltransferase 87 family protein [Candidatus Dormibacteraeota bacterium]|nr:glycosyltransferase 87 family protein [Candidatus Dormibacteraeota bacterium]